MRAYVDGVGRAAEREYVLWRRSVREAKRRKCMSEYNDEEVDVTVDKGALHTFKVDLPCVGHVCVEEDTTGDTVYVHMRVLLRRRISRTVIWKAFVATCHLLHAWTQKEMGKARRGRSV